MSHPYRPQLAIGWEELVQLSISHPVAQRSCDKDGATLFIPEQLSKIPSDGVHTAVGPPGKFGLGCAGDNTESGGLGTIERLVPVINLAPLWNVM